MNHERGARARSDRAALLAALSALALAPAGFAEDGADNASDNNDGAQLSEIVVTGTLIRGVAPVGTNVIDLSSQDIQVTGATTTAQLLQEIPQLGTFNTLTFPAAAGNTTTVNRPSLRELPGNTTSGGSTTLILLDGHRMVGVGVTSTTPDPDIIPPGALERVDIVPDGGSATYGADAVAGVINFITRRTFDGLQVDAHYGFANPGYYQWDTNLTAGHDWGSGGFYVSYNHAAHDDILGSDRSYVKTFPDQNGNLALTCNPGNVQIVNSIYGLPYTQATAVARPNQCNNALGNSIYPSERRDSVFARLAQDLGTVLKADLTAYYTRSVVGVANGPYQAFSPTTVPATNPYFASHQIGTGAQNAYFQLNGPGVGAQQVTINTFGITPTLTANLGATWQLRLLTNFGESTTTNHAQATNTTALGADVANGLFNPYDPSSSSQAALYGLTDFETYGHAYQRLGDVRLVADGDLLTLPGGAVKLAVGGEYYDETYASQTGTQVPYTQKSGFAGLSVGGVQIIPPDTPLNAVDLSHHVHSAFGQIDIPIFGADNALPGLRQLTVSAEGRWDEYSDFGSTRNPKFGFTWKPVEAVTLRGSWGTSFNAPSLADAQKADISTLFVLPEFAFGPTGSLLAANGGPYPNPVNKAGSLLPFPVVYVSRGNAPNIQPQFARTLSLGFDFQPPFVPGLLVGLTYWQINVSGVIGLPPGQNAQLVYGGYPSVVTVNPSIALLNQLQAAANSTPILAPCHNAPVNCTVYAYVNDDKQNLGDYDTDGLDFKARYAQQLGFGSFNLGVNGSYILQGKARSSYLQPFIDQISANVTRFRLQTMGGIQFHDLLAQLTWDHTGGFTLTPAVGYVPQGSVSAFDTVDLFFRYDLKRQDMFDNTSFTLNINNVLNASPPEFRQRQDTLLYSQGFTNGSTVGRLFQFGISKRI